MKRYRTIPFLWIIFIPAMAQVGQWKGSLQESIDRHSEEMIQMSDRIWALAETAFEEKESSRLLAEYAKKMGMQVEMGVAGLPTAFVASYGSGKPVIGILGEYDALPGLSQKAEPQKNALKEGAAGHGCGHNLFGVGSLGAAIAIKELMAAGHLQGTIRFYGTPAEEKYFGKLYMARAGLFDDLDVCLDWHPAAEVKVDVQSSLALVDFLVEFKGQAAHASFDPWNGRSAGDGMEIFTIGVNFLREHLRPSVRIHYHMEQSGEVVNVVPDYARIWTRVRDNSFKGMLEVYERVKEIARGAAIIADVDYEIHLISGLHDVLVNRTGGEVLQKNLELLGPIIYSEEEKNFARVMQRFTGKAELGLDGSVHALEETREMMTGASSDVGDVSWLVPEIRLGVTTAPTDTPWHSWAVVACGGMSIGHKGMLYAAKALGMTMIDLFTSPDTVEKIRSEFLQRRGDTPYEALLPPGPAPLPEKK